MKSQYQSYTVDDAYLIKEHCTERGNLIEFNLNYQWKEKANNLMNLIIMNSGNQCFFFVSNEN